MSARAMFREADLARALRAAKKVGVWVRVEIEQDRMVVLTTDLPPAAPVMTVDEMFS